MRSQKIVLNGVSYRWPAQPVVVVCIDGGDPAYIEQGLHDGIIPNIARFMKKGVASKKVVKRHWSGIAKRPVKATRHQWRPWRAFCPGRIPRRWSFA